MKLCIGFGEFNKYFLFILLSIIFDILNDSLSGFNYCEMFDEVKFLNTPSQQYFSWHHLIHQIFNYFGTFLFAFCFDKYESKMSQRESEKGIIKLHNKNIQYSLIFSDPEKYYNSKTIFIKCLIVIFIWIIEEQLIIIYNYALKDLDFWMAELLIITYFNSYMFKSMIFNHQKLSIWLNLFPSILKILTIILTLVKSDETLPILYKKNIIFIPIGITIYLLLITLRSFVNTKIKWFMDLKYISASKLLKLYGIMGTFVCTIICLVTTFVSCKTIKQDNYDDIRDYICKIPYNGKNKTNKIDGIYFDSFLYYYKTFSGKVGDLDFSIIEIFYEIIIIVSGIITFFFNKYFSISVIKNLTPVHLIFSTPLYFFIQKSFLIAYDLINGKSSLNKKEYLKYKFILDIAGDCFSILGFLIYLEIIELNCCNLDYNLKKNIYERSFLDYKAIDQIDSSLIDNMNEEEKEREKNEEAAEETEDSKDSSISSQQEDIINKN